MATLRDSTAFDMGIETLCLAWASRLLFNPAPSFPKAIKTGPERSVSQ